MEDMMKEQNAAVNEAAEYLDQIPKFSKEKHTVETVREMLKILGISQEDMKIVHIAGTNGKGSVCAFLSSILRESGHSFAVFTSPHLLSIRERFAFNGRDVEDELFLFAFRKVCDALEAFGEIGAGHPSYFEFLFLMFMVMVKESPCDYVILETGLGGRLDATNCVEHPLAAVITSVSLDHMEYLGDTVSKIAGEKAGIIKAGVPVIFDNTSAEASSVIRAKAEEMGSRAWPVDNTSYSGLELDGDHLKLLAKNKDGDREYRLDIPFAAEYQAVNSMLAFRTAELMGIGGDVICRGIGQAVWPGRMEQIMKDVYLDGAHNPGGIAAFLEAVRDVTGRREKEPYLLFAAVADKDYRSMAEAICREIPWRGIGIARMKNSRGLDTEKLAGIFRDFADCPVWEYEDAGTALHEMRKAAGEQLLFCAGSLYLIGELRECNSSDGLSS